MRAGHLRGQGPRLCRSWRKLGFIPGRPQPQWLVAAQQEAREPLVQQYLSALPLVPGSAQGGDRGVWGPHSQVKRPLLLPVGQLIAKHRWCPFRPHETLGPQGATARGPVH